jgi:hypothetical protein
VFEAEGVDGLDAAAQRRHAEVAGTDLGDRA